MCCLEKEHERTVCYCFWPQRKALILENILLSVAVHVPSLMLDPPIRGYRREQGISSSRSSFSLVMEMFASNVRAKQSGHGGAKNRLIVCRVWNLPKTIQ